MPLTSRATVVLPVPGLPVKTRCRVMVGALQAGLAAQLLDAEYGDLPVHLPLHPLQPDQGVELRQQLVEAALRLLPARRASGSVRRRLGSGAAAPASTAGVDGWRGAREPVRHGRQLGSGRDGGVADHAHRRLAQLAGGRGDLRQGPGVVGRVRGALGARASSGSRWASRATDARDSLRRRSPAWRSCHRPRRPSRSLPGARTRPRPRQGPAPRCGRPAGPPRRSPPGLRARRRPRPA